jgi:hypothetical protein
MKCVFVDGNIISAVSLCNLVFLEEMFEYKQCIYSGRNPYRSRLGKKGVLEFRSNLPSS